MGIFIKNGFMQECETGFQNCENLFKKGEGLWIYH